ncbi:MAG: helicase, partial [Bacteroidaceae bacterium]|nr:helicase [Bacteroidaceae bacterium]
QLEQILWHELGTREDYEHYVSSGGMNVAIFIRSIIHVDRQVALKKFVDFLKSSTLNARQEEYLKNIISYVCENGDIAPETLITTSPFCDYDIFDTFSSNPASIGQYVRMLHEVIEARG